MAKVNINFKSQAAANKLFKTFNRVKTNKQMNNEIGQFVVERIRFEARRESPLNKARSFPSLKGSTVKQRERLSKFNATHPSFSAPKSNATITGQLLDAVIFAISGKGVSIFVDDNRRKPYNTGPNSRQKRPPTNQQVDEFLRILGFRIYTAQGIKSEPKIMRRINSIVKATLRRALAVANK